MPIDKLKLDAIAKEIAECHMCRPHEMHVREILEKHFGEPKPEPLPLPLPCPLCGEPPLITLNGHVACSLLECSMCSRGTWKLADWNKLAGNRLTLPLPVDGTAYPVTDVSGIAIRAIVFGATDAAIFAATFAGRRVLSPISIATTVAGEDK